MQTMRKLSSCCTDCTPERPPSIQKFGFVSVRHRHVKMASANAPASEPKGLKKFMSKVAKLVKSGRKSTTKAATSAASVTVATAAPQVNETAPTVEVPAIAAVPVVAEPTPEAAEAAPTVQVEEAPVEPEVAPVLAQPEEATTGSSEISHTFRRSAPSDATVSIAGTFSNWDPVALAFDAAVSEFAVEMKLKSGEAYEYKYILNGEWLCDSSLPTVTDDAGNVNNVLRL